MRSENKQADGKAQYLITNMFRPVPEINNS
jgi:hypothetical protein